MMLKITSRLCQSRNVAALEERNRSKSFEQSNSVISIGASMRIAKGMRKAMSMRQTNEPCYCGTFHRHKLMV